MYQEPFVTLVNGDCREVLIGLPAESVDMVMTSPPYYGLRSYKAEPAIWDSLNGCQHGWVDHYQPAKGGHTLPDNPSIVGAQRIINADNSNPRFGVHSSFCHLCGAWRGQLGAEPDPDLFIKHLCDIFDLVKRVLKKGGSIYVNLDDSHSGSGGDHKPGGKNDAGFQGKTFRGVMPKYLDDVPAKSLIGIPERFMLEMIRRGWICRNVLIWKKDSVMPESVKDRFTIDFERIFFFSKSPKYFFERQFEPYTEPLDRWGGQVLKANGQSKWDEGTGQTAYRDRDMRPNSLGRNTRSVWTKNPQGFAGPHYATYPEELCRIPIEASCPEQICTNCGKPRTKVYERECKRTNPSTSYTANTEWNHNGEGKSTLHTENGDVTNTLIGLSDCNCGAPFEPGIVLDPFSGVGTTCVMAKKLGRKSIGIEISPTYFKLAVKRVEGTNAPLKLEYV